MAPMIDMVFLLLVFFMTASAMSQAGTKVAVNLPDAPSSVVPKDLSHRLVVTIDTAGTVFLGAKSIELDDLRKRLEDARAEVPDVKLRIRADKTTPFKAVKSVMQQAAKAGVASYIYATYQSDGDA